MGLKEGESGEPWSGRGRGCGSESVTSTVRSASEEMDSLVFMSARVGHGYLVRISVLAMHSLFLVGSHGRKFDADAAVRMKAMSLRMVSCGVVTTCEA